MAAAQRREFTWTEGLAICLAMVGVQLSSEVMNQWGTYFYSPSVGVGRTIYVAIGLVGYIFIVGTVWDAITDPLIGVWSDWTRTRPGWLRLLPIRGRRRPFIFWGSIFMTFTAIGFWYPPVEGLSGANFVYGAVLLCLHWTMFTVTTVPLISLSPEIARSESERVRLGTFVAVGMISGLALAAVAPGLLITVLDPARTEDRLTLTLPGGLAPEAVERAMDTMLPETLAAGFAAERVDGALRVTPPPDYVDQAVAVAADGVLELVFTGGLLETLDHFDGPHVREAVDGVLPASVHGRRVFESGSFHLAAVFPADAVAARTAADLEDVLFGRLAERLGGQLDIAHAGGEVTVTFTGGLLRELGPDALESLLREALPPDTALPALELSEETGAYAARFGASAFPFAPDTAARHLLAPVFREHLDVEARGGEWRVVFYRSLLKALNFAQLERRIAAALPGAVFTLAREEGSFSAQGYRRLAWTLALLSLALFQLPVWLVRERYDSAAAGNADRASYLRGLADAARNRPFVIYFIAFFMFSAGFLAAQRALPYWAELGLGGDEGTVTQLMVPFLFTALLSYAFIPALTRRLHVKWMMVIAFLIITTGLPFMYAVGKADLEFSTKVLLGGALFGYCGIGQGILYVLMMPMMGEIIDYDEARSGERREALYNGLSGVAWKSSMAASIFFATTSMDLWGNSVKNYEGVLLVGPIAGLLGFIGLVAMLFYPVLKVARGR